MDKVDTQMSSTGKEAAQAREAAQGKGEGSHDWRPH